MLPRAATEFYALQQRVSTTAANEVRRIWRRQMGDDFDSSWRRTSPAILAVLAEAQSEMAVRANVYTHDLLDELRIPDRPEGEFLPDSLVGIASDGRRLDTLAYQSVVTAKSTIGEGATTAQGLDAGAEFLHLMAQLQVADAARVALGIGSASRRNIAGNVRVLNPPVCQRCAILGGRFYRWSKGFDRHPGDDCTMMPVRSESEAQAWVNDPMDAYKAGQIKDLTAAQVKAIDEGAKLTDVVNAYRGMSTTATERTLSGRMIHMQTKDAVKADAMRQASLSAGHPDLLAPLRDLPRVKEGTFRLTPEGIYDVAGDDRGEAIRLLREWGYIT